MEKQCGGKENVGFTRKDAYNHNDRMKKETKIANGDAQAIMEFFKEKSTKEPLFFWKVQLDDDGRLMHFFFRDYRSYVDYDHFGDVVSFDTTYKTNKYNMVCAPFVGINHHFENVMFGLGFLSDETSESFEWLFGAFLKSMFGKEPGVIFSDQCQALMNGVACSFESSRHRLCQWHINCNATSHFGSLTHDKIFRKEWKHCMNGCETEEEFEERWRQMINTYELGGNRWFGSMYSQRRRWCSAFINDRFTAGLHATSRSEATNRVLKLFNKRTDTLFEFVNHYMDVQDEWRAEERAEDVYCRGMPGTLIDENPLLTHIASVVTRTVFRKFEIEATNSLNIDFARHPVDYFDENLEFHVKSNKDSGRIRKVFYNRTTLDTSCSCCMWETSGIFCRHIFKVYYLMSVHSMPEQYILKRWRRDCKERWGPSPRVRDNSFVPKNFNEILFVNHIVRMVYDMAVEIKGNASSRFIMYDDIWKLKGKLLPTGEITPRPGRSLEICEENVRNPALARTRGIRSNGESPRKTKKKKKKN